MSAVQQFKPDSEDEYLAADRESETKYEFVGGEIIAMSGGSLRHNAIPLNISAFLLPFLRKRGCIAFLSDQRIKTPLTGAYMYPDLTIVCGTPQTDPKQKQTLLNPIIRVEVLSESTEKYDRKTKFFQYQTIPSLRHYLIVYQDEHRVEVYNQDERGGWNYFNISGDDALLNLFAIDCLLPLSVIYEGIDALGGE